MKSGRTAVWMLLVLGTAMLFLTGCVARKGKVLETLAETDVLMTEAEPTPEPTLEPTPEPTPEPENPDFSFIWLSDTQSMIYTERLKGSYTEMIDWIISQKEDKNIIGVLHTGDIVEDAFLEKEWKEPDEGAKRLEEAGIEFIPVAGNHDLGNRHYLKW